MHDQPHGSSHDVSACCCLGLEECSGVVEATLGWDPPVPGLGEPAGFMVIPVDGGCRVLLRGELDIAAATGLGNRLVGLGPVEIDLATVTFLDARGLSELLRAQAELHRSGSPCHLIGAMGLVRRVFDITGLAHHLDG